MRIIPAIDLIQGKSVRLERGNFQLCTEYAQEPAAIASNYAAAGFRELHVVDLDGARRGSIQNWKAIESILEVRQLEIQVGGGIRTTGQIERLIQAGAARIVIGSVAVLSPQVLADWIAQFGAGRFCLALDLRNGRLAVHGWQEDMGVDLKALIRKWLDAGINRFLCTDIDRDGLLNGPNTELYKLLTQSFPAIQWLASGGASSRKDLLDLEKTGVAAVVVGRALQDGILKQEEVKGFLC